MGGHGASFKPENDDFTIPGTVYSSDYKEFMHANSKNPEFKEYYKRNHTIMPLFEQAQMVRFRQLQRSAEEMGLDEAVDAVRNGIPDNVRHGWFVEADSDYKPRLLSYVMSSDKLMNAGWTIAYHNYVHEVGASKALPFKKWLYTPMTLYRGDNGQKRVAGDIFTSFSRDEKIAKGFGKNVTKIKIRPIDTYGSYQTTGEQEYLIPYKNLERR